MAPLYYCPRTRLGYPRAVLRLEQGLTILFVYCSRHAPLENSRNRHHHHHRQQQQQRHTRTDCRQSQRIFAHLYRRQHHLVTLDRPSRDPRPLLSRHASRDVMSASFRSADHVLSRHVRHAHRSSVRLRGRQDYEIYDSPSVRSSIG